MTAMTVTLMMIQKRGGGEYCIAALRLRRPIWSGASAVRSCHQKQASSATVSWLATFRAAARMLRTRSALASAHAIFACKSPRLSSTGMKCTHGRSRTW